MQTEYDRTVERLAKMFLSYGRCRLSMSNNSIFLSGLSTIAACEFEGLD
ncbi:MULTISPECIES: hypothetical protein [Aerosakkonema]